MLPGLPVFEMHKLDVRLVSDDNGVSVRSSGVATYWDRLVIAGHVAFSDLSASLNLDASGLKLNDALRDLHSDLAQTLVLSDAGMRWQARTDGRTSINLALTLAASNLGVKRWVRGSTQARCGSLERAGLTARRCRPVSRR